MAKKLLTVPGLKALKAADKRYDVMDADTRGLGIRVGATKKTWILFTRFPGSTAPIRAQLGEYPAMSLDEAREKARAWRNEIAKGKDPRDGEKAALAEQARKRENTFRAVVEDYLADLPNRKRNRHIAQDEREIRRELLERRDRKTNKITWSNSWASKPVADVTDEDIAELIGAIRDRPAVGMAYNTLGHLKSIFDWSMWPERRRGYGLTDDPTRNLKPKHLRLPSKTDTARTRVLSDDELRALWKAAEATPYPLGPFYKLLVLTGQRKTEVSDARWSEFDMAQNLWTVPAERFKMGGDHLVPLSAAATKVVESLPRQDNGDYLFSDPRTKGAKPINGFSRAKTALDEKMFAILRETSPKAEIPPWTFHDIRRTVRTRLAPITKTEIAEHVIGHSKKGIERVYNYYEYRAEMREALNAWADVLDQIVNPQPPKKADNVVPLRA